MKTANVGENTYDLNREQLRAAMRVAKASVPHGIYAIEKNGIVIFQNRKIETPSHLRKKVKELEDKGFKVYWNK